MKKKKQKYRLKISAATENLKIIRDFVHRLAESAGFSEEQCDQIELAVDEACTNVIKHAYRFNQRRMIQLDVVLDTEKMETIITDNGKGFDPARIDGPDIKDSIKKGQSGGLGIHLMKKLMDRVHFDVERGKKTRVHLIKLKKSA